MSFLVPCDFSMKLSDSTLTNLGHPSRRQGSVYLAAVGSYASLAIHRIDHALATVSTKTIATRPCPSRCAKVATEKVLCTPAHHVLTSLYSTWWSMLTHRVDQRRQLWRRNFQPQAGKLNCPAARPTVKTTGCSSRTVCSAVSLYLAAIIILLASFLDGRTSAIPPAVEQRIRQNSWCRTRTITT